MTEIPGVYMDLLQEKRALAHLATVMPDGSPQNTPVWFDYVDGKIDLLDSNGYTGLNDIANHPAKGAIQYAVSPRGVCILTTGSALWRRPRRVVSMPEISA